MRKLISFILRWAIVAGCMVWACWGLDWGLFLDAMKKFGPISITLALIFSFIQYIPVAWRLNFLTGNEAGFLISLKASVFCLGVNNLFPAKLGEVAKAFYMRKKTGISLGKNLGLIFWERFFDLNYLLLLGLIAALILGRNLVVVPMSLLVGGIWAMIILFRLFPSLSGLLGKLVPGERLRLLYSDVMHQLQARIKPSFLVILGAYSAVVWVGFASVVAVVILFVAGIPMGFAEVLTVFVVSSIGYALPATPGGLGVYEAAFVGAMKIFGIDKETALAVALVVHFIIYVPPVLAALYVMAQSGMSLKGIREHGEDL